MVAARLSNLKPGYHGNQHSGSLQLETPTRADVKQLIKVPEGSLHRAKICGRLWISSYVDVICVTPTNDLRASRDDPAVTQNRTFAPRFCKPIREGTAGQGPWPGYSFCVTHRLIPCKIRALTVQRSTHANLVTGE